MTSDEVLNAFGIFIEEYGLKGAEETKLADDFAKYVSGTTAVHGLLIRESCFTKSKEEKGSKIFAVILGVLYLNIRITSWVTGGFSRAIYYGRWTFVLYLRE